MKKILLLAALFAGSMSMMAEDVMTASVYGSADGKESFLRLGLTNTTTFVAFQSDITLPAGVAIPENAVSTFSRLNDNGEVTIDSKTESTNFVVAYNQIDATNNVWRIVAYNLGNHAITGNEGEIMAIKLVAESSEAIESITPAIAGVQFVNGSLAEAPLADIAEIATALNGDVNGDGKVNAGDYTGVCGVVLDASASGDKSAADVNADGKLNAGDVTGVASIILNN